MKKNKLYTANKWNQPAFMVDRRGNLFLGGGGMGSLSANSPADFWGINTSINSSLPTTLSPQNNQALGAQQYLANQATHKMSNPFSFKEAFSSEGLKSGLKAGAGAAFSAGAGIVGGLANSAISGGLESGAGSAISGIGSQVGSAVGAVNPILGAAVSVGSQVLGGLTNRMFGSKLNEENIANIKNKNKELLAAGNATAGAETTKDLLSNWGNADLSLNFDKDYVGTDGWFSNKAAKKFEELRRQKEAAQRSAIHGLETGIQNIDTNLDNNVASNFIYAFGGPLEQYNDNMGAIGYGFMSDYLTEKKRQNDLKNKQTGLTQMPAFMNGFAFGGDLQTHGSDWPTGMTHIKAGGSHEENKYDGVQMGVDPEGVPNLVEEGEVVFNDYVYSARIPIDETTKEKFRIGKKRDITYADLAKKLEKEIQERPNDPISRSAFEKQMASLAEEQERQKQEMDAERAKAAFEAMSPEQQTAVMQQVAQQEQMAQQAAQEQAVAEQAAMQQPTPEEAAMMQQQMMQEDGTQAMVGQEPQMNCMGGKLYAKGGDTKKNAGTWKKGSAKENWDKYSRNGLRDFLLKVNDDLAEAKTEEEKNKIRENAIKTVRGIQQAYSEAYQNNLTPSEVNEKVTALQKAFQEAGGNAYFGDIADNINLPKGHNTTDTEEKGWVDGLWGPRTSIRNWGSTEYGDDYDDIRELAAEAGLSYAPGQYKYGDNTLYELGMAQPEVAAVPEEEFLPDPYTEGWEERRAAAGDKAAQTPEGKKEDEKKKVPIHRNETLRYAGLLGPAVGLGMQMAGIGRPDTGSIDAAISGSGNYREASYQPIGNYLTYRPLDIWYEQNRLNANARATDRAILNSGANQGSKMAGLLASGYNDQIASGNLFRQAQEYNDALRKQVAEFNRGTDMYNSEQFGQTSRFNASAYNDANRFARQMALHAAQQKAQMDAGWYNGIYGNVAGLFKGLGDLGTENYRMNRIAEMGADGIFGNLGTSYTGKPYVKDGKSQGGKIKKGKKRGLTY